MYVDTTTNNIQVLQNWPDELWKLDTAKYSFALSIHRDVGTKPQGLRRIPTSLHRCILTSHMILYCMIRSLREYSLSLRDMGHTRTNNGLLNLWKRCYQRRTQGWAKEAKPPQKFLENIVIFCFGKRFSRQNSVIRLKSNIFLHKFLGLQNFCAGYAADCYRLTHGSFHKV